MNNFCISFQINFNIILSFSYSLSSFILKIKELLNFLSGILTKQLDYTILLHFPFIKKLSYKVHMVALNDLKKLQFISDSFRLLESYSSSYSFLSIFHINFSTKSCTSLAQELLILPYSFLCLSISFGILQ